jgi:hypothetical protein
MKYSAELPATRVATRLAGAAYGVLGFALVAAPITAQDGH